MRRVVVAALAALLLPLTGCGKNAVDDYCGDLEGRRTQISDMVGSDSPSALLDGLPMLRDLADIKAPEDIADEWQTYLRALTGLDEAIKKAGIKPSAFKDGKPPEGLSATDLQAIAEAAGQVSADPVVEASSAIEQQARDVCKVNLGL